MPVIAGVMGPKAIARAAHWADGVDGAWTMDGDLDHMTAVVRADPRRVGGRRPHRARRTSRRASGTRSATTPRRGCASYAHTYMKIMGEGVGDWAAGSVTCFTPDALRAAVDHAREAGADEFFLVPTHVGSRRARAHARRARAS